MCGRHGRGPTPQYLRNAGKRRANLSQCRKALVLRNGSISSVQTVSDVVQIAYDFIQRCCRTAKRLGIDRRLRLARGRVFKGYTRAEKLRGSVLPRGSFLPG